jgi:hypothetical protein
MSEYLPHICDRFGSLPGRVISLLDAGCGCPIQIFCSGENNQGSFLTEEPGSGYAMKIGIRFHVPSEPAVPKPVFNRDPILIAEPDPGSSGKNDSWIFSAEQEI